MRGKFLGEVRDSRLSVQHNFNRVLGDSTKVGPIGFMLSIVGLVVAFAFLTATLLVGFVKVAVMLTFMAVAAPVILVVVWLDSLWLALRFWFDLVTKND